MTTLSTKEKKEPSFIVHSDIEILQRLEETDRLFKAWKMWFSTLEDSYNNLSKKLNIK